MSDSAAASERRQRPEPAGRGTLRDEQRRMTRRLLADAALELFEQSGYAAATADGIAKRAGANRATFYLHYSGKADVVLELMDRINDEVIRLVSAVGALEDPGPEDVRAWLAEVVAFWDRNRALIDANHQAMPVEPRVAQRWWSGFESIADAMPRLWNDQRDRLRLIAALIGLERMCWFHVLGEAPVDRPLLLDAMAEEWQAVLDRAQTPRDLGP